MPATRREFLGLAAGALIVGGCRSGDGDGGAPARDTTTTSLPTTTTTEPPVGPNPFTLGVASGDPDASSVVLWTHVDRPPGNIAVSFEVARNVEFTEMVAAGFTTADTATGMTTRILVEDLEPDTRYWYRFVLDGHRTPVARTRTAPAPGAIPREPLRFGHLSCQRYSSGYWTALDDVAALAPDLVVHCGDYVYESDHLGDVRPLDTRPPTSLEEYRELWRRYRAEAELQAAHAVAPWLVVWDDHEVENNYQGDASARRGVGTDEFLELRAAAYRAWWEFTPTRVDPPEGPSVQMHRQVDWGGLARFVMLDTRQHRDDQPCGDSDQGARCDATDDLTMLGAEQEAWVEEAVRHEAVWTTVVQQVVLHQWRLLPGNVLWNLDQWDGYTGARTRFLDALGGAPNPVVLSGDVHSSWVSDLRADFDDEDSEAIGVEFVAPGVSSGVPADLAGRGELVELSSPHIVWSETRRRGWVLHTVTEADWTAEYRLVADATEPNSDVAVEDRFTVSAGARQTSPS